MTKDLINCTITLLVFTILLLGVHIYISHLFFSKNVLYLPIWGIYVFHFFLVAFVFFTIRLKQNTNSFTLFLVLTIVKMVLSIVFLLPIIMGKSEEKVLEIMNFFIPYFFYLTFEIYYINNYLKKQ